jgi:hypothetical protein
MAAGRTRGRTSDRDPSPPTTGGRPGRSANGRAVLLFALEPEDSNRLAISIGVGSTDLRYLLIPSSQMSPSDRYRQRWSDRGKLSVLARLSDVVGLLVLTGPAIWFVFWRD